MSSRCIIRADSGSAIGVGHVSRCLALAGALRDRGLSVQFVCREHPGAALAWICACGFDLRTLPPPAAQPVVGDYASWLGDAWQGDLAATAAAADGPADWLVVDHYGVGADWERGARRWARRILVVDDLTDRRHDCDLLLNQNLCRPGIYRGKVPDATAVLTGPRYALLRGEFAAARETLPPKSGEVGHILVFFGGSDPTGETVKAVESLQDLDLQSRNVDCIVAAGNPWTARIEELCARMPAVRVHRQVPDMARHLSRADLAIGAAGVSSWERLALGVPAVVIAIAENQVDIMRQLAAAGVAVCLGRSAEVSREALTAAVDALLRAPAALRDMSARALALVDGHGTHRVAERVVAAA